MKISKLIIDYKKYGDAKLNQKAVNVKLSLTGIENFPKNIPALEDFTTLQQSFETALGITTTADRIQIALKNQIRASLLVAMRHLAFDIEAQANGDKAKLLSSGLDLVSKSDGSGEITAPTDFRIVDGVNAGELRFMCKKVAGAVAYVFEYTDAPPTEETKWSSQTGSTREIIIKGLRSNVRIYGRIKAVGRKGQEAYSEILSRIVQ